MKLSILLSFIFSMAFFTTAQAESDVDPDLPLQEMLGSIQVQYPTENCGIRNVVIVASLEYFGADKTARIQGFVPKINSHLFIYVSDYAARRAGKEIRNKDLIKIIQKTTDRILGEEYISDVLLLSVMQN